MGDAHVAVVIDVVSDDDTMEAPFITDDFGEHAFVGAGPSGTDTVEGGHEAKTAKIAIKLEWLEVDFADGLLVAPGVDLDTFFLLIVKGHVLGVAIDAIFHGALGGVTSHEAREERIFGIVFEVTSAVWGTMDVDARSVPAG